MLAWICASVSILALGVLARWVADLGGAAAHHDDGLVAGLLQAAQEHDLDQAADVQTGGRGVEADCRRAVAPDAVAVSRPSRSEHWWM